MPIGERLAEALTVRVADNAGTAFRLVGRSSGGGGGAELYCEWAFVPAMAAEASSLTITVVAADGSSTTHTVEMGAHSTP